MWASRIQNSNIISLTRKFIWISEFGLVIQQTQGIPLFWSEAWHKNLLTCHYYRIFGSSLKPTTFAHPFMSLSFVAIVLPRPRTVLPLPLFEPLDCPWPLLVVPAPLVFPFSSHQSRNLISWKQLFTSWPFFRQWVHWCSLFKLIDLWILLWRNLCRWFLVLLL